MTLTCPVSMVIRIDEAVYGHYDSQACPGPVDSTNCRLLVDFYIVSYMCSGHNSCDIEVGSGVFSIDPCPNTQKYLDVNYECLQISKYSKLYVLKTISYLLWMVIYQFYF